MPRPHRTVTQQEVHDAYEALYKQLSDAFWVATTIENKDRIRGLADAIFDILTDLNRADIQSRTSEFAELKKTVNEVNKRLGQLQKDIDKIVHVVKVAGSLTMAIDNGLKLGSRFFAV